MLVTVWERARGNTGRIDEGERGQQVCTEIMIYSEEVSYPVGKISPPPSRTKASKKYSVTNE